MSDLILLILIDFLLWLALFMRINLAKKKKSPLNGGKILQLIVFPCCLLLAILLFAAGVCDIVIPVIFLGVLEELIFYFIGRKAEKS